jgi:uncharacterized protein YvpB
MALAIAVGVLSLARGALPVSASTDVMLHVPVVKQDMPLDCESAALASAMQYKGVRISQEAVFAALPNDTRGAVVRNGALVHWGDPYTAFIGNVWGSEEAYTGYGVYYPPIARVADGHGLTTDAHGGWTLAQLVGELAAGNPVVVWVDWHLLPLSMSSYVAFDGRRVWFSTEEHAQVLMGYDQARGSITLMDPWDGDDQTYGAGTFMARFDAMDAEAVAVKNVPPPTPAPTPCPSFGPLGPLTATPWAVAECKPGVKVTPPPGAARTVRPLPAVQG